jgi:CheY-like chemotaxis protein
MIKNVLVVDDDQEMLLALKDGLEKYHETFSLLLAEDGMKAVNILNSKTVSLVVTDLKMPGMDGFALLAHVMESYPDIPVVVITGYSTAEMERLAKEGGAVGYIAKPFMMETLARKILITLRKESEGGTLHSVSSGIFLQLMEMEQKTCTIRLVDKSTGKKGILFFRDGELLDARIERNQGDIAAYEIFSWDQVNLSIQNGCALHENRIQRDLQHLILEAMRRKDEVTAGDSPSEFKEPEPADQLQSIKHKILSGIGNRSGLEDIYQDGSWDERLNQFSMIGKTLNMGNFKLGYADNGDRNDYILLPGMKTTVIALNPKCPRDKILQILSD